MSSSLLPFFLFPLPPFSLSLPLFLPLRTYEGSGGRMGGSGGQEPERRALERRQLRVGEGWSGGCSWRGPEWQWQALEQRRWHASEGWSGGERWSGNDCVRARAAVAVASGGDRSGNGRREAGTGVSTTPSRSASPPPCRRRRRTSSSKPWQGLAIPGSQKERNFVAASTVCQLRDGQTILF